MMNHLLEVTQAVLPMVPDPGSGTAPPGSGGLTKILSWAAWSGFAVCVLGFIGTGVFMAVSVWGENHRGSQHMGKLFVVMLACIIIGSASGLVGALN